MKRFAAALALTLTLTACAETGGTEKNYSPQVEKRISKMEKAKNCDGLQRQFDIADKNKNVDVMDLVDDAMQKVCY